MDKLAIQRQVPDHFRSLGYKLPQEPSIPWDQPVLECDHDTCQLSFESVVAELMKITLELVPSQSCTMYLYDKRSRLLSTHASTNPKRQLDVKFAPAMGIVGRCFSRKVPLSLEKPSENALFEAKSDGKINKGVESMLCIPILVNEKAIGLFQLVNRVGEKRDKFHDLDRYMEGFNNLKFNADHMADSTSEYAFRPQDISTLTEYTALVASSLEHCIRKLEEADAAKTNGNSALDLLNMLNGKLSGNPTDQTFELIPERKESIPIVEVTVKPRNLVAKAAEKLKAKRKSRSILFVKPNTNVKEKFVKAALKCQSCGRGWLVRRQRILDRLRMEKNAKHELHHTRALRIQKTFRGVKARNQVREMRTAMEIIGEAIMHYIQRKKDPKAVRTFKSSRTRKTWAQTSSRLLWEQTKLKQKRVTNIQKLYRGHKVRTEIKEKFGASNPAKVFRSFVKLQARFKGRLVRKLIEKHTILHQQALQKPTSAPQLSIIRMKTNQVSTPPAQSKGYPHCHTGMNQYIVANRGQIPDLVPLFDALRLRRPPPKVNHLPHIRCHSTPPEIPFDISSRRLVASHQSARLPQIGTPPTLTRASEVQSKAVYDSRSTKRRSAITKSVESIGTKPFDVRRYHHYRAQVIAHAVGAPTPPPPKKANTPRAPYRPFLCLVHHAEDIKREGIRRALEELKTYYENRIVAGPVGRRKSIKEVMDECSTLVGSPSVRSIVHRVKSSSGVDFNAPLLVPETVEEESVCTMDSIDSLALDYRPVTPMLDAIELLPPMPSTHLDDMELSTNLLNHY